MNKDAFERLRMAREQAGFQTPTAAANFFGWNENTYKSHENGIRGLKTAVAERYAEAFKVSAAWLLTGEGSMKTVSLAKGTVYKETGPINGVKVTGKVAANTWMSVDEMDFGFDDVEYLPSLGGFPVEWQYGLRVSGQCLNRIAREGDALICLNLALSGVETKDGDLVIVERRRYSGQMVERTAKRLRKTTAGFELWPESDHPDHQRPIVLSAGEDSEEIQIIAKVIFIIRKP